VRWYPSGRPRSLTHYAQGQREGLHRGWYADGTLEVEGVFQGDQAHGRWRRWFESGALSVQLELRDGVAHGPAESRYPDGSVSRSWAYASGRQHGLDRTWLTDGSLFSEASWADGERDGPRRQWMRGHLVLDEVWRAGRRHGPHRAASWMGLPQAHGAYVDGERDGPWCFFDPTGAPELEGSFDAGAPRGPWRGRVEGAWVTLDPADLPPLPEPDLPPAPAEPEVGPMLLRTAGPTPTLMVTGFLGAGKSTTIRHLLASKPADQRWVVYVNEAGEVGIDGASFGTEQAGLQVRELAGGCACCTSNLPFVEGVAQAIEALQPDLLVLEPTGLADPGALRSSLGRALGDQLDLRAVLCLVDPRRLDDPDLAPLLTAQLAAADVVVGNRWDLASESDQAAFAARVAALPARVTVLRTTRGQVDPALVTLAAQPPPAVTLAPRPPSVGAVGATLPPGPPFDRARLEALLCEVLADPCAFPAGWLRAKGLLRTASGPFRVEADQGPAGVTLEWTAQPFEGPDRLEVLAGGAAAPDWARLDGARG